MPLPPADDSLLATAADWFARMRGPDAERHRTEFDLWLAANPSHRAAYDRMALRFDQAGLVGHTPSGQARVGLPEAPARRPVRAPLYALAASLAVVVLVGLIYAHHPFGGSSRHSAQESIAQRELTSPVGTIRRVTLPDGSVVTLDTASRIALVFTDGERRLRLLAGRARFEVAHDAMRPFVVMAGQGEVVATGTLFDVSLVGERPQVRLIQGSVAVRMLAGGSPRVVVPRLVPGQAVALGEQDAKPVPLAADRWVAGTLSFDNAPLRDVIAEANRYSTRPIRLADKALEDLRVTGGFKAGDQEAIADALAAGLDLQAVRGSDGDLMLRRRRTAR